MRIDKKNLPELNIDEYFIYKLNDSNEYRYFKNYQGGEKFVGIGQKPLTFEVDSEVQDFLELTSDYENVIVSPKLLVKSTKTIQDKPKRESRPIFKQVSHRLPFRKEINIGIYFCCYCGTVLTEKNYTRDHIIPVSRRGTNKRTNLIACCGACNTEKGNLMLHSYVQLLNLKWADSVTGSDEYKLLETKIKNSNLIARNLDLIYEENEPNGDKIE